MGSELEHGVPREDERAGKSYKVEGIMPKYKCMKCGANYYGWCTTVETCSVCGGKIVPAETEDENVSGKSIPTRDKDASAL